MAIDDTLHRVTDNAREIYRTRLDPIAEKLLFRIPVPAAERQGQPMVLVLGNHSAGKSSFVNHLLGRDVQKTGVAPTDDGFTVIAAGPVDEERDGAALVGTPALGLGELQRFGPTLVSHLTLKLRAGSPLLERLWLIDSPGMIDASTHVDRGYDFFGAVRWLAERADVILLLFDPEKPGTTGETLTCLTSALAGLDHKLLIVLNKADEFHNIQDYARAYGALCWNLAKVIPRKDLPRIYNCYIPGPGRPVSRTMPVDDFDRSRADIAAEVQRAPERRIDNVVTHLHQDARELLVHARVADAVRGAYRRELWAWRFRALGVALIALAPVAVTYMMNAPLLRENAWAAAGLVLLGIAVAAGLLALGRRQARVHASTLLDDLTPVFEQLYQRFLTMADSGDLRALWERIKERSTSALRTLGVERIPRVSGRQLSRIEGVLSRTVPELRAGVHDRGAVAAEAPSAVPELEDARPA
jgi:hypothetical protein